MLAGLLNIPHSADDWAKWSWNHRLSHDKIRAGIKAARGYDMTDHIVDPISPVDLRGFLENNSQLHSDMNSVLALQGTNLEDADLTKQNELASWINLHYLEHQYAELKLGIGS